MLKRLFEPISGLDLEVLQELALKEHDAFFQRNPRLREAYHSSLVGIALCQGAAWHYINTSIGIKDFDIWLFYRKSEKVNLRCRHRKSVEDGYKRRRIDSLRRAIDRDLCDVYSNEADKCIMQYLLQRDTQTKRLLLRKSVVGLFPDQIVGKIMWKGQPS